MRATLVIDHARHELACGSCGAPLHNLKQMPSRVGASCFNAGPATAGTLKRPKRAGKPKKPKKSKAKSFFGEALDLLEDLFD
ncbi:MAG: hypothetical protein ACI9IV_001163 [Paracoccaceae bacterium]|jgi:hypothetical protein|tara:strand:- start:680 stop:925 length:246 start_codon:yes stop_codon:yes gene_type:complete